MKKALFLLVSLLFVVGLTVSTSDAFAIEKASLFKTEIRIVKQYDGILYKHFNSDAEIFDFYFSVPAPSVAKTPEINITYNLRNEFKGVARGPPRIRDKI